MKFFALFAAGVSIASAAATPGCSSDNCARAVTGTVRGLVAQSSAKKDCESFFRSTVYPTTVTSTATTTIFPFSATVTRTTATISQTVTVYPFTATSFSTTATSVLTVTEVAVITASTQVVTATIGTVTIVPRAVTVGPSAITVKPSSVPTYASACSGTVRYSSACSCFGATRAVTTLPTPTTTTTRTITGTTTFTRQIAATSVGTLSLTTTIISYVGYTTTATFTETASVTVTETSSVQATTTATPTSLAFCSDGRRVNGLAPGLCMLEPCRTFNFRIEGLTDTLFEGPVRLGPRTISTPSGGTHLCDGTNNGANPSPGPASSVGIDAGASLCSYTYDGTWSPSFSDYFITRIGADSSPGSGSQYWGVLNNFIFTIGGGCQTQEQEGGEALWAFDAFSKNYALEVQPRFATIAVEGIVEFTITAVNTNSGYRVPAAGANFGGLLADTNGKVVYIATSPGTKRVKAERSDSIRSPGAVITVI